MNWLIPALISPLLYTATNFIDKYLIEKLLPDYRVVPILSGSIGFIAGTIFFALNGFTFIDHRDGAIILVTGILTLWGLVPYYEALMSEETSKIIILFQSIPIFVLTLSYIFLGETISQKQLIGFALILASAMLVSASSISDFKFKINKPFVLIIIVNLLWAVSAVLLKFSLGSYDLKTIINYEGWGVGIGALYLYIFSSEIRNAFNKTMKKLKKYTIGVMCLNEVIFITAKSVMFFAYSLGPAALVSVVGSAQAFWGILAGAVLTLLFPRIFKEDIGKDTIVKKVVCSAVMITGIWLVS